MRKVIFKNTIQYIGVKKARRRGCEADLAKLFAKQITYLMVLGEF